MEAGHARCEASARAAPTVDIVLRACTQVSTARPSVSAAFTIKSAPAMALKAAKKQLAVPGATCPAMKKNGRLPTTFEQRLYRVRSLRMHSVRD